MEGDFMNLSFVDMGNTFSSLAHLVGQQPGPVMSGDSKHQYQAFADKLKQVLNQARSAHPPAEMNHLEKKVTLDPAETAYLHEAVQEQGLPFLSKLQAMFLKLSGGDLKSVSMDAQGLEALKKILLMAGFGSQEVDELISGLVEKAETKDLNLQEVMDQLLALSSGNDDLSIPQETILASSVLPFIIDILNSLGISRENVDQMISLADRGEKGISLDVLLHQLKAIETLSFYTGQQFKTQDQDTSFVKLFEQLGLVLPKDYAVTSPDVIVNEKPGQVGPALPENKAKEISLSQFLASLETLKQKLTDAKIPATDHPGVRQDNPLNTGVKESASNLMESLFKHLELKSEKTGVPAFSYAQIKDQFINELIIPDKHEPHKKGLFSQSQPGTELKSEPIFKEIQSILSQKSNPMVDSRSLLKEGEGSAKSLKPDTAKAGDLFQGGSLDIKTEGSMAALKTKAVVQNLPTHVAHQVGKSLVRAINQGETVLKIQLKPPELGRLIMTIDNVGNSMKVSITTENPVAKEILISHMNELKTVLANAGISLDKFDVDLNSNFRQSYADAQKQSGHSSRKGQNSFFDSMNPEEMNDPANIPAAAGQSGSYHFVA